MDNMHQEKTENSRKAGSGAPSYEPPRIVTYSAEDLDKHTPQVTACESFNPLGFQASDNPSQPVKPGGTY